MTQAPYPSECGALNAERREIVLTSIKEVCNHRNCGVSMRMWLSRLVLDQRLSGTHLRLMPAGR